MCANNHRLDRDFSFREGLQTTQPWKQPLADDGLAGGQCQTSMSGAENRLGAVAQPFERKADMGQPRFALDGQRDGPRSTFEQGCAEVLLQLPDPLADRGLRQSDVFSGGGKAAEPSRRLEGADPFERWKTIPFHKPNDASGHKFLI